MCKRNFLKLINNVPYETTIENVAKCTFNKVLTYMKKARRITEKPQCINQPGLGCRRITQNHSGDNKSYYHARLEYSKLDMYRIYATLRNKFVSESAYCIQTINA